MAFSKASLASALLAGAALWAQAPGVAHLQAPASVPAKAHATVVAPFTVTVENGFHIQSNHPKLDYLIASTLTLAPSHGIAAAKVAWPKPEDHTFSFSPDPLSVFEGTFPLPVTLTTGAAGTYLVHGTFRYQACNDQLCRPPVTQPFAFTLVAKP